jgi:hypothetical protein
MLRADCWGNGRGSVRADITHHWGQEIWCMEIGRAQQQDVFPDVTPLHLKHSTEAGRRRWMSRAAFAPSWPDISRPRGCRGLQGLQKAHVLQVSHLASCSCSHLGGVEGVVSSTSTDLEGEDSHLAGSDEYPTPWAHLANTLLRIKGPLGSSACLSGDYCSNW